MIDVGVPGTFDDHGVVPVSVVKAQDGRVFCIMSGSNSAGQFDIGYSLVLPLARITSDRFTSLKRRQFSNEVLLSCISGAAAMHCTTQDVFASGASEVVPGSNLVINQFPFTT
ncbi:MAG TPA: hypothetical protein VEH77_04985 [Roseiarcus sp.]|nr:hypothetical protein [Roseiarcus sp.]